MKKIKHWYTAIFSAVFALVATFMLGCLSIVSSVRAETPADVALNIRSSDNMTATTETVDGKEMTAYGCDGWGNVLTYFTLEQADASAVYATNKGAIAFWLCFNNETSLNAYKNVSGNFNIDVSSGSSYSDAHKYSFVINALFADCEVGWNKILLPLATAGEKNDMDWSNICNLRLNGNGCGLGAGASSMKFAGFTVTTTDEESMQVVKEQAEMPADVALNIRSSDNMTATTETVDGKEMTAYGCDGWGNVLTYFTLEQADASAVYATNKGAIAFWLCFNNETSLNAYKNVSGNFNIDVSSGSSYSDAHKYSFVINSLFANCEVGWNKILLPLATAGEKNDMDWSNICNLRLNGNGCGLGAGASSMKFAGFTVTTTDEESMQVVKDRGDEPEIPADVEMNIGSSSNMTATTETVGGKETTAYGCTGWGNVLTIFSLDQAYDASKIYATGKGALTFWMYFANEASLNAYKAMEGTFIMDVSSQAQYEGGDAHKYAFEISSLFDYCSVGWNKILLPFATAAEKSDINWKGVYSIRLNGTGSAVADGASNLKFASFAFTVSDEARMTVLTNTANVLLTVSNAQDFAVTNETIGDMQATAYGCAEYGWGRFVKVLTLDRDYNVQAIADTNKGAFSFWMYIADDATLAAYKATTDFWSVDVCSSVNYNDTNKYTFMIASVFDDCVVGWNKMVLPFASAQEKLAIDWSKVRTLRLNCTGTALAAGSNNVKFAEFAFIVSDETAMKITQTVAAQTGGGEEEDLHPIDELVIIDCNSASGTYFSGNKVDKEDFRYGTGCVYTSGAGYGLTATDIEVGKTDLRKNTIVFAMWIWIEDVTLFDAAGVNGQIELSSSNAFDKNEIFWENWWGGLKNGWNWLVLRGEDASVSGGLPDFDNLKRFRIYVNGVSQSTMKIDRLTIGNVKNAKLFDEPDWENEKANSGLFKGANGYVAENDSYIGVDFGAAEGFTVIEQQTFTVETGCGGVIFGRTSEIVLLLLVTAAAVTIVAAKPSKKKR
mgnify:CR=1 FL=1